VNGAPLPTGGVADNAGALKPIEAVSAMTESIDSCFKGPPGSIGKAKPKATQGQLDSQDRKSLTRGLARLSTGSLAINRRIS
jgi:hypothetical protein